MVIRCMNAIINDRVLQKPTFECHSLGDSRGLLSARRSRSEAMQSLRLWKKCMDSPKAEKHEIMPTNPRGVLTSQLQWPP